MHDLFIRNGWKLIQTGWELIGDGWDPCGANYKCAEIIYDFALGCFEGKLIDFAMSSTEIASGSLTMEDFYESFRTSNADSEIRMFDISE